MRLTPRGTRLTARGETVLATLALIAFLIAYGALTNVIGG